jgi:hypothetical protein
MSTFCLLHFLLRIIRQKTILHCHRLPIALENAIRKVWANQEETKLNATHQLFFLPLHHQTCSGTCHKEMAQVWNWLLTSFSVKCQNAEAIPPLPPWALKEYASITKIINWKWSASFKVILFLLKTSQNRQCKYNITSRHVCATTVAAEKQWVLHIVSVCSLRYPACNAHVPYCHLQYFSTLSHKQHDLKKKKLNEDKMCVLTFSTTFISNTSHSRMNWVR